jgi:hypothetical protein
VLPAWNKAYAYPEIRIASPSDFFSYVDEKYGNTLPALSGDLNNFSGDYATIDPESQSWKRQASRALPAAEGLSALDSYLDPSYQPTGARAAAIWNQIFDYDEHSWPTQPKATDLQLFNASWIKKQGAERALRDASKLLDAGMDSLASHIRSDSRRIVVFNSLAHQRDDVVMFAGSCDSVEDLATAEAAPMPTSRRKPEHVHRPGGSRLRIQGVSLVVADARGRFHQSNFCYPRRHIQPVLCHPL